MAIFSLYDLQPDLPPIKILDVGAADDDPQYPTPYAALVAGGHAHLIGFEPDLPSCMALNKKHGKPHQFFPLFVGAGGPARFHKTTHANTGSLFKPNMPVLDLFSNLSAPMTLVETKEVQTVRLDDIAEIDEIDFFKIDVQGSELDVFKGAEKALASALIVQTEVEFVEMYENQPLFGDVDRHLRERGFWFHTFVGMISMTMKPLQVGEIDYGLNQRLWSDAVYVRHLLRLTGLPPVRLRKMAALAHDVYRSYDLAFHCLKIADELDGDTRAVLYLARLTQP